MGVAAARVGRRLAAVVRLQRRRGRHDAGYAKDSEQFAARAGERLGGAQGGRVTRAAPTSTSPTSRRTGACTSRSRAIRGEVDAIRLPKEAYYVVKTMWTEPPQVHIVGHWNYPANTTKDINVASNGDTVELFVNGTSVGKNSTPTDTYLFTFKAVKWAAGSIRAVAYKGGAIRPAGEEDGGRPVRAAAHGDDGARWSARRRRRLRDDRRRGGRQRRQPLPDRSGARRFHVSGPGVWRGGYNSGKANSTNNTYLDTEAGLNRVFVRFDARAGKHHGERDARGPDGGVGEGRLGAGRGGGGAQPRDAGGLYGSAVKSRAAFAGFVLALLGCGADDSVPGQGKTGAGASGGTATGVGGASTGTGTNTNTNTNTSASASASMSASTSTSTTSTGGAAGAGGSGESADAGEPPRDAAGEG